MAIDDVKAEKGPVQTATRPKLGRLKEALNLSRLEKQHSGARLHLEAGKHFLEKRQFDSAELCFDQAIRTTPVDKSIMIETLIAKAELCKQKEAFEKAQSYLSKAQEFAEKENELRRLLGFVWKKKGDIAFAEGLYNYALEAYTKAKEVFTSLKLNSAEAMVASLLAATAFKLFQFDVSLRNYVEAAERAEDPLAVLDAKTGQIDALTALSRPEEALKQCDNVESAIRQHRAIVRDKDSRQLRVLWKKAVNFSLQGRLSDEIETYRKSLPLASIAQQARLYAALAESEFSRGNPECAANYEEEAKALSEGSEKEIPEMLLALSRLNLMRGDVIASEKQLFDASIELPDRVEEGERLGFDLHSLNLYLAKGELAPAIELANTLYSTLSAANPKPIAFASVLNVLGSIAHLQGEVDEAEALYAEALDLARALKAPLTEAGSLRGLAQIEASRFNQDLAREYFDKAIDLARQCERRVYEHSLLVQRSSPRLQAADTAEEAVAILSDFLIEGYQFQSLSLDLSASVALGLLHWQEMGDPAKALSYLEDVCKEAADAGLQFTELISKGLVGSILQDEGERVEAEQFLEEVLKKMSELGLEIGAKYEFDERYHDLTGLWF